MIEKTRAFINSKTFLFVVIGLFLLQALWVAVSFKYPMVYDEAYHFEIIKFMTNQWSPIITSQPPQYDFLRDIVNETSFLFHYLLSIPLRFTMLFTDSIALQVIPLRIINIVIAASGLVLYAKLLRKIGIRWTYINIGILLFVLLPIVSFVSATINYDNLLFFCIPLYLIVCLRVLNLNDVKWYDYMWLITIGCFTSLVKYTFLPLFLASLLFVGIWIILQKRSNTTEHIVQSFRNVPKRFIAFTIIPLLVMVCLFTAVYVKNVVVYGTPSPSCTRTKEKARCLVNVIEQRNEKARTTKSERTLMRPADYSLRWTEAMIKGSMMTSVGGKTTQYAPPIAYHVIYAGVFLAIISVLLVWRSLRKNVYFYFVLTMCAVIILSVYVFNILSYYRIHQAFAMQPRYVLPAIIILLILAVFCASTLLSKVTYKSKLLLLVVMLLLIGQGGGVLTHLLRSTDGWYWYQETVIQTNEKLRYVVQHLVKEH